MIFIKTSLSTVAVARSSPDLFVQRVQVILLQVPFFNNWSIGHFWEIGNFWKLLWREINLFFTISYPGPKDFQSVVVEMTVLHNESLKNIFWGLGWRICGFAETAFLLYGVKSAGESLTKLLMKLPSPQGWSCSDHSSPSSRWLPRCRELPFLSAKKKIANGIYLKPRHSLKNEW